ncbi:hypothetical protein C1H46_037097 [Malus baccata]|uniref:Uncharacterized protein n=1 Tax=Malus baccata TaxID=106549 RepID=A0A540KT14_MALBA|nr:hypothetical protein C1H46_037097 [Malus baccata]
MTHNARKVFDEMPHPRFQQALKSVLGFGFWSAKVKNKKAAMDGMCKNCYLAL